MRDDDERLFPPGTVPVLAAIVGLLVGLALLCALLIARCERSEPTQMIPPVATSTAIATASAQAGGTQRIRVTIPQNAQKPALDVAPQGPRQGGRGQSVVLAGPSPDPSRSPGKGSSVEASNGAGSGDIVIEFEQVLTAGATSSAEASASIADDTIGRGKLAPADLPVPDHGRLGVAALTMPGVLAADLQLLRLDVSPLTRWLVAIPLEVGLDVAGNLEAGAVGVSAGSKAFAVGGAWSRWNLTQQGYFVGLGLRF